LGIIVIGESSSGLNFVKAADQLRPETGHQTPDPKRITGISPHSKFKRHNKPQQEIISGLLNLLLDNFLMVGGIFLKIALITPLDQAETGV